jgi:hypothetical protein
MDWNWIQGRMEQDEALDKLDKAVSEWEAARERFYSMMYWAEFARIHRN